MWQPDLDKSIKELAKGCQLCLEAPKTPLQLWSWPSKPWQKVHVDFAGPFMGKNFFHAIDAHCKQGEVIEMSSTTMLKTIEVLCHLFATCELPQQIVYDNSPQFISRDFSAFLKANGVKHTQCTPYHPASDGVAKRFARMYQGLKYDGLSLSR